MLKILSQRTSSYWNAHKLSGGVVLTGLLLCAQPVLIADAHQSPGNCNSNRFNTAIIKDKTQVTQGDTLTYTVTASNVNSGSDLACDITAADIDITLPAADGTPTGTVVSLATNQNYIAGTGISTIGSVPYVVNVNPGVTDIIAQVRASGTLHDAPVDHAALIVKTIGTSVVTPTVNIPPSSGGGGQILASTTTTTLPEVVAAPKFPNTGTAGQ